MTENIYLIDATGKKLGRLASEAAKELRGKNSPSFTPHLPPKNKVKIINAAKLQLSGNKFKAGERVRYTGYPGGLRSLSLEKVTEKHGYSELCRHAIMGMIPRNKLRPIIMKNLTITE